MAQVSERPKYRTLSLAEKATVIRAAEKKNCSQTQIAHAFGLPKTTLSSILKKKNSILAALDASHLGPQRKRLRGSSFPDVEECLYMWYLQARNHDMVISGPNLQARATTFAHILGYTEFQCSEGWVDRFKSRKNIVFKRSDGATTSKQTLCASAASEALEHWVVNFRTLLHDFHPKDIFSVGETGLFWRFFPNRAGEVKYETCQDGSLSEDRVTVLVACNMDGTQKLPLVVVGNSVTPPCCDKDFTDDVPVEFIFNSRSWMTSDIFSEWMDRLDSKMGRQKRKIALVMDSGLPHLPSRCLEWIRVVLLPPKCTTHRQPYSMGIVLNMKLHYRKSLLSYLMKCSASGEELTITLTDAVYWLQSAWTAVTSNTIVDSFFKAGFSKENSSECSIISNTCNSFNDPEIIEYCQNVLNDLRRQGGEFALSEEILAEDFVGIDDYLLTTGIMSEQEIVDAVLSKKRVSENSGSLDENGEQLEGLDPSWGIKEFQSLGCILPDDSRAFRTDDSSTGGFRSDDRSRSNESVFDVDVATDTDSVSRDSLSAATNNQSSAHQKGEAPFQQQPSTSDTTLLPLLPSYNSEEYSVADPEVPSPATRHLKQMHIVPRRTSTPNSRSKPSTSTYVPNSIKADVEERCLNPSYFDSSREDVGSTIQEDENLVLDVNIDDFPASSSGTVSRLPRDNVATHSARRFGYDDTMIPTAADAMKALMVVHSYIFSRPSVSETVSDSFCHLMEFMSSSVLTEIKKKRVSRENLSRNLRSETTARPEPDTTIESEENQMNSTWSGRTLLSILRK